MMNKNSKLEWRVAAYMAIWTVIAALVKWGFNYRFETPASVIGYSIIGVICITFAVAFSFFEKHGNTPFLWFKTAPTKHWAMPGLGVFSNASCGENGTEIDRDMVELGIGNDQSTQKTEDR